MPADQIARREPPSNAKIAHDFGHFARPAARHRHCISGLSDMYFNLMRKLAVLVPLLAFLMAGRSSADTGGTTGTGAGGTTGTLAASDFTSLYFEKWNGNDDWGQLNQTETKFFFNRARCECASSKDGHVKVRIVPAAAAPTKIKSIIQSSLNAKDDGRLYVGSTVTTCLDVSSTTALALPSYCINLYDPLDYTHKFSLTEFSASNRVESPAFPVSWMFAAMRKRACNSYDDCNRPGNCGTTNDTVNVAFWAQTNPNDKPDFGDILLTATLAGQAPPAPNKVEMKGGNDALVVSWDWDDTVTNPTALAAYSGVQIFCARGADVQVFGKDDVDGGARNYFKPHYMTAKTLCPEDTTVDTSSYGAFGNLDPKYICSDLIPAGTNSHRITGLQNDIYYTVGVAAIDRYGNISPITQLQYGKPIPTVDFYSDYRENGGQAMGGFCTLTGWQRRAGGLTMVSLLVVGLLVVVRRRRGPPGSTALLLLVAATLVASRAQAEGLFFDDMDTSGDSNKERYPTPEPEAPPPRPPSTWTGSERTFAVELRFGLYMPNVDSEFGGKTPPHPNSTIFENYRRPMWQVEFDWEFLQVFGTLSLGGTIGYWKENGRACLASTSVSTGYTKCEATGDNTSLRLIPFAALLVYRMDEAATRWGIPIVPYGKIGLNYTIWTINNGDGNVPNYKGGRGQGGTAGWQAAAGFALQLDFIDPAATREFDSESGINHTYAFFELDHVDGSGLYRSDVLQVGDNTWFAGLMFEF
jgi:hypothetical protein